MVTPVVFHKKQNLKTPLERLQLIKARQGCLKLASMNPATSVSLVVTFSNYISTDPTQAGKGETVTASGPRGHWRTSQHVADQEP